MDQEPPQRGLRHPGLWLPMGKALKFQRKLTDHSRDLKVPKPANSREELEVLFTKEPNSAQTLR